ncbi:superoxide dismutase [Rhizorhapis suberifaciens]|uniref:Superoxide dismutase n=1 Tax=Rhizorhapis suberifaciens TaxID=13656 RepID=A0A840HVK2_9SPHN|nr:superoxide dismutase [Rhizorhapis suberifaciens]MBB4641711.1 Fe-Mn family superoxide dismutase [Rhizorhapis suberifaciens]
MSFLLPELPYAKNAFGEIISEETFNYHHGKHHNAYVVKANELIPQAGLEGAKLSQAIKASKEMGKTGLFNQVGQIWNHSFYWLCLSPEKQQPSGKLLDMIQRSFGSLNDMLNQFKTEAVGHFGSGWAWLVLNKGELEIASLHDADTPVAYEGMKPLLTIDVWEHAYYIDYRNARPDYVDALLRNSINWEFVAQNLDGEGVRRADQPG